MKETAKVVRRTCVQCQQEFKATGKNRFRRRFCSKACGQQFFRQASRVAPEVITKWCEECGKKFEARGRRRTYVRCCSLECSRKLHNRELAQAYHETYQYLSVKLTCQQCGQGFVAKGKNSTRRRYCSPSCRNLANRERQRQKHGPEAIPQKICVVCKKRFAPDRFHPFQKTCSDVCNQARMNQQRAEARARLRDMSPKFCLNCAGPIQVNKFNWYKVKYCSNSCALSGYRKNNRSPRHYNPLYRSAEWKRIARAARERDDWRCKVCGKSSKRLNVHHKDGSGDLPVPNNDIMNLVSLCSVCHRKIHNIDLVKLGDAWVVSGLAFQWLGISRVAVFQEVLDRPGRGKKE